MTELRYAGNHQVLRKAGTLRRGQLITTFGCGAIVDLPGESAIIAGTDYWTDDLRFRLTEESLMQLLGVDYFVSPPTAPEDSGELCEYSIRAFRFPTWMYCPVCKRLAPAAKFGFTEKPKCGKCRVQLVPSRFVVACPDGHLDDFPYEWWVHHGKTCAKGRPELTLNMSEQRSGLDSIMIECHCGESRTMAGSFNEHALKDLKCTGKRPWLNDTDPSPCMNEMRTVQRGATNLHFNVTVSALSIPPWSRKAQIELGRHWAVLKNLVSEADTFKRVVKSMGLTEKCKCSPDDLFEEAKRKYEQISEPESKTWQQIIEEEYRAFQRGSTSEVDEFKTKPEPVPDFLNGFISRVVLAQRLREVLVLRGFKRLSPQYDINDHQSFSRLSREIKNWLPAIELKGEGIFIELDEAKVSEWEKRPEVLSRYEQKIARSVPTSSGINRSSPRYILLHTFAHILIRQLILQCGYSGASLKERIYSTFAGSPTGISMAGVLIYTATNDSEGTLGGLVREGQVERFDNTLRRMLESASWCSADPVCIQSAGQGLNALNLAACHACALLPETSCENRNSLLDRSALVGNLECGSAGFFADLLGRGNSNEQDDTAVI